MMLIYHDSHVTIINSVNHVAVIYFSLFFCRCGMEWLLSGVYSLYHICLMQCFSCNCTKICFFQNGRKKEIGPITIFINHTFISIFKIIFLLELLTFTLSKAVLKGKHTCILQRLIIMFCFQTTWASCNDRGIQWVLFLQ